MQGETRSRFLARVFPSLFTFPCSCFSLLVHRRDDATLPRTQVTASAPAPGVGGRGEVRMRTERLPRLFGSGKEAVGC